MHRPLEQLNCVSGSQVGKAETATYMSATKSLNPVSMIKMLLTASARSSKSNHLTEEILLEKEKGKKKRQKMNYTGEIPESGLSHPMIFL